MALKKKYESGNVIGYRNGCGRGVQLLRDRLPDERVPDELDIQDDGVAVPIYRTVVDGEEIESRGEPIVI